MKTGTRFSPPLLRPVADIRTILVPVDCGPRTPSLLRSASALARRVGAELVILHVYEPITFAPPHCTAEHLRTWQASRRRDNEAKFEKIREQFRDDPEILMATFLAVEGYPETEICASAEQFMADVIVASTHGYGGLSRLFLGSKADQLIRHAPCPVLLLPPVEEGAEEEDGLIELPYAEALAPTCLEP